jgi:tetratricopeptide (TPR) repeat protein
MSENSGTILQDLRDFTVQIRRPNSEAIVGTGIAVSPDGRIITCAHVVRDAIGVHPRQAGQRPVGVYFPQARGDESKARQATVAACFADHDDDVVVLQLEGGPPPLDPEQMPTLGTAEPSAYHPFRSYGYRRLDKYLAGHAHGTILDAVEPPVRASLQTEPIQVESKQINRGMSGAAVLDIERNLVVGLLSEVWRADTSGIDQGTGWAVNARVLSLPPLAVPLSDAPRPRQAAPRPQPEYRAAAQRLAHVRPQSQFHAAPPPLAEWVGRSELLDGLNRDFGDPARRVTGLIGFGGEGKSSLARRWVDSLDDLENRPTGVFWWGFYDNSSVDEFFEKALEFVSGGQIDPRRIPSSSARAQVVAALLANGRFLFVLDGLEVLQRQEGDDYGLLRSPDLLTFLELFAAPGHDSFCLITSRAPLLDLLAYESYTHRDVGAVSPADGRALLRALGVKGTDGQLDRLVAQWDGHALTLSLVGTYLKWQHGGDVRLAHDFDPVEADTAELRDAPDEMRQRYGHVHRMLRRYDAHLSHAERELLRRFSAFRTPVTVDALRKVREWDADDADKKAGFWGRLFKRDRDDGDKNGLGQMGEVEFEGLLRRLAGYRLLRYNESAATYTSHPLVRNHYLALLCQSGRAAQTHAQIKAYYLSLTGDTPHNPTLEQLAPLIEVVYHACRAGAYDEAYRIHEERIIQKNRFVLLHQLGAFESELTLIQQFFPNGDTQQEPQVSSPRDKSWILNTVGLCLMNLGRLATAVPFYERSTQIDLDREDWHNASRGYQNLANLNTHLGRLAAGAAAAARALVLARRAENKQAERNSLAWQGWLAHLRGEPVAATAAFQQATALEREIDSSKQHLYSQRGIRHATHLWRTGQADAARQITAANLAICERNRVASQISMCHRLLADLDGAAGDPDGHVRAAEGYAKALRIARSISHRPTLIEALLARGRWAARYHADLDLTGFQNLSGLLPQAFADLNEALGYAVEGGYRIYEADIRIGLAWAQQAAARADAARQEAQRALTLSEKMGYHWGLVDAAEFVRA